MCECFSNFYADRHKELHTLGSSGRATPSATSFVRETISERKAYVNRAKRPQRAASESTLCAERRLASLATMTCSSRWRSCWNLEFWPDGSRVSVCSRMAFLPSIRGRHCDELGKRLALVVRRENRRPIALICDCKREMSRTKETIVHVRDVRRSPIGKCPTLLPARSPIGKCPTCDVLPRVRKEPIMRVRDIGSQRTVIQYSDLI